VDFGVNFSWMFCEMDLFASRIGKAGGRFSRKSFLDVFCEMMRPCSLLPEHEVS
jgi:hypothetical protein